MTHSFRATEKLLPVSQLKCNIQNILSNIKKMEALQCETVTSESNIDSLMQQTDELIKVVEKSPLERLAKTIKKRKERRKIKKSKVKEIKTHVVSKNVLQMPSSIASTTVLPSYEASARTHTETSNCLTSTITKKLQIRLLKHDSQRFLRKVDMGSTRSEVLKYNAPESTKERHLEDQWNDVFFGPVEHSYYDEQNRGDFIRIRRIWDSYLTRSKQGTHIPCGWVLPRENALREWQQYKAT
ncbi:uncharacterized protein LOC118754582 [Rhagoletis pomonella]|uniref:uncharacterized protein LOC118754561 n=1 Tax=Rhagoletis pomonella TaxID=28610 RepID=UPI00178013BE|nr:uncharacterized protein LOC118754561 [Rhagoletis pomonella]XP_036345367.1 uncharacterized protein LOC118754582 [Rhagoletis pomonella]